MIRRWRSAAVLLTLMVVCQSAGLTPASAQESLFPKDLEFSGIPSPTDFEPVSLGAQFRMKPDSREGVLYLKAEIAPLWHLYSPTQPPPLIRSSITIRSDQVTKQATIKADRKSHDYTNEIGDAVEEYESEVVFAAPIRVDEGVDLESLVIEVRFSGQSCVTNLDGTPGQCIQVTSDLKAPFSGYLKAAGPPADYKPKSHLNLKGTLRADGPVKPGDTVVLEITAEPTADDPADPYHIYQYRPVQDNPDENSTLIALDRINGWKVGEVEASEPAEEHEIFGIVSLFHVNEVTWKVPITIPEDAEAKTYTLSGLLGFQTCTESTCDMPEAARFSVDLKVGDPIPETIRLSFSAAESYDAVKEEAARLKGLEAPEQAADKGGDEADVIMASPQEIEEMAALYNAEEPIRYVTINDIRRNSGEAVREPAKTTFLTALIGAFLGGMLLNLMPCVFPVLGIKVLGFVEQAGSDKAKIRMHGLAFTAGLVVSMWALAGVILAIKLVGGSDVNWGMQMSYPPFVAGIILLMFILGLNMAGVFELGTSLTRAGGNLDQTKGYTGSFFSGILTTLVATPCSGPFLGVAMSYTLSQTVPLALFLFTIFGLGIASPYLFLAFFPALINKLPRPGAWMETFKVTMSFALFATAAFFMKTFGAQTGVAGLSWLIMAMVVIGLGLYFYGHWGLPHIGRVKRLLGGYALPAALGLTGLYMIYDATSYPPPPVQHSAGGLPWLNWHPGRVPYTLAKSEKIVWVDYTADW